MAHPEQLKAAAMAALLSGQSAHQVARRFDLSRTTVRRWRDQAWRAVQQNGPQKRAIGDQVMGYVGETLTTQRVQLHAMMDREWLLKQSARDLAMLHGTLFDQMVRVAVAFEYPPENPPPGGASGEV